MVESTFEFSYNALIVDSDEGYVKSIEDHYRQAKHQILRFQHARNMSEFEAAIHSKANAIHWVFLNPTSHYCRVLPLLTRLHKVRPVTPVYLLYENQLPFPSIELNRLAVHSVVPKGQLQKTLAVLLKRTIESASIAYLKNPSVANYSASSRDEAGAYIGIPAADLLNGANSFLDIFVRNEDGSYKKIVEPNDNFTFEHVKLYLDQGINNFYVSKQSLERLLAYCGVLSKSLISRADVSLDVRWVETMSFGQEVLEKVKSSVLSAELIDNAIEYTKYIRALIPELEAGDGKLLASFLNDVEAYDSAVTTTLLAILIGKALSVETEVLQQNISVAAFFHDLGLFALPKELQAKSVEELTPAEKVLYTTHPQRGADELRKLGILEETVLQAVSQHHERKDRSGYPGLVHGHKINRIAEIIGLSDEFLLVLKKKKRVKDFNIGTELEKTVYPKFSFQVVEAFKRTFGKMI